MIGEHSMDERLAALLEYSRGSVRAIPEFTTIINILNELSERVKKIEDTLERTRDYYRRDRL